MPIFTPMFGIDLPAGVLRLVASYIDTVTCGARALRRGGAHANAPVAVALGMLRDLARLLRLALLIVACRIDLDPAPRRAARAKPPRAWRPPLPAFPLFPRYRVRDADAPKHPRPNGFAPELRNPVLSAMRKMAAISRVLANPTPYIRRMARRLPRQLMVIGWRPPKRAPSALRRQTHDDLVCAHAEAWFQLREFRRRRRDIDSLKTSAA